MSYRHKAMGIWERNRFEQGLGTVAGFSNPWSLGETPNGDQEARLGSRDQGWLPAGLPSLRVQGIFCTTESVPISSSFCKHQVRSDALFNRYQAINLLVPTSLEHADLASLGKVMGRAGGGGRVGGAVPCPLLWVSGFFWKPELRLGLGGWGQGGRKRIVFVFERRLIWNLLCSPVWPGICHHPPSSDFRVLGLQV